MQMLVLTLLTFKKVKLIFGHPVYRFSRSNVQCIMQIDYVETKCVVLQIITIICHTCAKEFLDSNFN